MKTIQLHYSLKIPTLKINNCNSKTVRHSTHRKAHVVELIDEGFHPGIILFVDWFVHLKMLSGDTTTFIYENSATS